MEVLKPPTDNLYKFIAIFGLVIFVLSTAAPYVASERLSVLTAEMAKPIAEMNAFNKENDHLLARWSEVIKSLPDQPTNLTETERQSLRSKLDESDRIQEEVRDNIRKIRELEASSDVSMKNANARARTLLGVIWWSDAGKVIGLVSIVLGFTLWYFKLQRHQDLLLRNQALAPTKEAAAKVDETPAATD